MIGLLKCNWRRRLFAIFFLFYANRNFTC